MDNSMEYVRRGEETDGDLDESLVSLMEMPDPDLWDLVLPDSVGNEGNDKM